MYDSENKDDNFDNLGIDNEGYCTVEDDPEPADNCETFEDADTNMFDDDEEELED